MNVFLPFKRDANLIIDEIENFFDGNFIYDHFSNFNNYQIDIVNIHWPESIFDFTAPTSYQLDLLETELIKWKEKAKIIYTRHNILPHKNDSAQFTKLYNLIVKYADGIIHLGSFSFNEFKNSYPEYSNKKMTIINHPAYTLLKNDISLIEARQKLKIPLQKKVILVFGSVRTKKELSLIFNAFRNLYVKDKFLLISNLNIYKPLPVTCFQRLKKYITTKIEHITNYLKKDTLIHYNFINNNDVQTYLNAADILFIPRINLLNSGNLFLGFTFKKIVVAPAIGNLLEILEETDNPSFNPFDINSVSLALKKGLMLNKNKGYENYNYVITNCHPSNIAISYYNFFNSFLVIN